MNVRQGANSRAKRLGRDRQLQRLPADGVAAAVVQAKLDRQRAVGTRAGPRPSSRRSPNRVTFRTTSRGAAAVLLHDARAAERLDERQARAVAAGHFRPRRPTLRSCRSAIRPAPPSRVRPSRRWLRPRRASCGAGVSMRLATTAVIRTRRQSLPHEDDARVRRRRTKLQTHVPPAPKPKPIHRCRLRLIVRCCRSACIKVGSRRFLENRTTSLSPPFPRSIASAAHGSR